MDELTSTWSAPRPAVALGVVAATGLAAWAVGSTDPPGRLLVGLAAVALAVATAVGGLARPRLAARPDGLELRGVRGVRRWPWTRVDAVRVVRMRRLGLPATYVEVDARDADGSETLLVLGRLELGEDPADVAAVLQDHRARAGRTGTGAGSGVTSTASAETAERQRLAGHGPESEVADRDDGDEDDDDEDDEPDPDRRP